MRAVTLKQVQCYIKAADGMFSRNVQCASCNDVHKREQKMKAQQVICRNRKMPDEPGCPQCPTNALNLIIHDVRDLLVAFRSVAPPRKGRRGALHELGNSAISMQCGWFLIFGERTRVDLTTPKRKRTKSFSTNDVRLHKIGTEVKCRNR